MAVRALLYDFDGTLVDTESVDLRSWQEVFAAHGVEVPLERFLLRVGTLNGPDELDELDALLGSPCDREAVLEARRRRELELLAAEPLREGVREHLAAARERGLRLGIVSSSPREWVESGLERLGVAGGWAVVACADGDRERCKPNPALYLEALAALGVAAWEAIAFEDSPNGVAAARAAGVFCVAVPNPVTRALDLSAADVVVESLAEMPLDALLSLRDGMELVLARTTLADERTVALVLRLNEELSALYPEPGANHFTLDPESVLPPRGVMVRADLDGVPVACGAIRVLDDRRAEVKRMFVDPARRGRGIGAALLERLEAEARALGASELVLETGVRQHAAIALYERAGFEPTPPWGEYLRSPETSRCYRKPL